MVPTNPADAKTIESSTIVPEGVLNKAAWVRLEDQIRWYDNKSLHSQKYYKGLKLTQVAAAMLIPVASLLPPDCAKWITAAFGVAVALLEAVQQMNQYSTLWVMYRATAERLKHEKFLFLSAAGPYRGLIVPDALILLAERVEEHVSTEHANWFNETRRVTGPAKQANGQ